MGWLAFAEGYESDKTPPLWTKTAAIRHLAASQSGARALPCFRPATSTSDCKLHPSPYPGPVPSRRSYGIAVILVGLRPDPSPCPPDVDCLSWRIKVPRLDPTIFMAHGRGHLTLVRQSSSFFRPRNLHKSSIFCTRYIRAIKKWHAVTVNEKRNGIDVDFYLKIILLYDSVRHTS